MTKDNKKTNNKNRATNQSSQNRKELRRTGFYYSFLTIVLLFCLIQMGFSGILNISKLISYKAKTILLEKTLNNAKEYNQELKEEIKIYSSTQNLEGIARNKLKMAGEDEVLIIINNSETAPESKKKNKKNEVKNAQWRKRSFRIH